MAFDVDDEILADFLVEAGEILELLQEQLVELENNPEDSKLLNAIFRGYHTVKGGAGFLSLTELVDICHCAENVFDVMRNGQRSFTPELMDAILQATDEVVQMFDLVKAGDPLVAAEKSLIDTLTRLRKPESSDKAAPKSEPKYAVDEITTNNDVATTSGDFSEDEFEALLDE
ncbi:MAG: Hpt domain-containing protein, partial [Sinobacterium sp.]